ncbi:MULTISPECIES: hypothetical protein [Leptospira]|uniref:Uncharacterized protein n=2 Tax=Leptospira borgpetersenii TaxID=174 RepID=M3F6U6_LEPBO|nr:MULTISPECIES: hypothetical protein [Leptospira]EMF97692.1 hypothetical protein LEP1GSC123_1230 [Leptospira borgpetersenii str. 200701203]AXX17368.1 hypothetical protein C4Q31_17465 [Leptospira borgpetersenii serovar Ceylonica]EKP11606.1 hypothetical protein LEP1GSC128_1090 [Leptospira borgpetersenii str. 200801926]EMN58671.1 hypothetical protein LEP1GSC090_2630 [Leptospira borgpetersenii serovar Javanica str. MK146]ENO63105.1 hypothetical protein LEP1GSC191_4120 [Leptospira borgpetersenii s
MFFRTRTIFLAHFLLAGLLGLGMSGELSASESEVLKVPQALVHQEEVDRVLSVPVARETSTLDQDDFFVSNSKAIGKTKSYRANSIWKEVLSSGMYNIATNFQSLHSNFQNFDLRFEDTTLSTIRNFSTETRMSILTKSDSGSVLSLEDFEKSKIKNISGRSRETVVSYMIRNFLTLSLFQNLFCSEVSLVLLENYIYPSQQIKLVGNLAKKTLIQINQFDKNRKEFSVRSFPNLVRVPTFLSIFPWSGELIFLHQKEEANQIYSPIFSFVTRAMRLLHLPFVNAYQHFERFASKIQTYASLKTVEIERNHSPKKEDISFKTPPNEGVIETKERV